MSRERLELIGYPDAIGIYFAHACGPLQGQIFEYSQCSTAADPIHAAAVRESLTKAPVWIDQPLWEAFILLIATGCEFTIIWSPSDAGAGAGDSHRLCGAAK